ncbi:MAG: hypothetical protein FWC46_04825 [Actinomycetia bacterium]|nr:hypothetical protein [Actinomycetes bacterium]
MSASPRLAAAALAAGLMLSLTGCVRPAPDPLPDLPPYSEGAYTPSTTHRPTTPAPKPTTTPTRTETTPSVQPSYPIVSATPIPGFPTNHTIATVNTHIAAGTWAFVQIPSSTGSAELTTVAIRMNGLWEGAPGSLAGRPYTGETGLDLATATPFYVSWTYVVTQGNPLAVPPVIDMPGDAGHLYVVSGPFSDRDCPDYTAKLDRGFGVDVLKCSVTATSDGASITGLAVEVPGSQPKAYWFFDPPPAAPKPTASG